MHILIGGMGAADQRHSVDGSSPAVAGAVAGAVRRLTRAVGALHLRHGYIGSFLNGRILISYQDILISYQEILISYQEILISYFILKQC